MVQSGGSFVLTMLVRHRTPRKCEIRSLSDTNERISDFSHATAAVDIPMHLTTCSLRKNNQKRCRVDFGLPHQCNDAPASSRYDQNVRV